MRRLLIALLLITAACGQAPAQAGASPATESPTPSATATAAASPSPSPSPIISSKPTPKPSPLPQPSTSKSLLFAVLEAKGTTSAYTWNTVAIAGLDGYARAKATFIPMPAPDLGCMGSILPPSAHVAAGRVYFADGKGVVRSLSATGLVTTVATFPLTSSQQMLSFAVSPDGSRLLGAVLTVPAKYFACSGGQSTQALTLDVYSTQAGGASTLLYRQSFTDSSKVMALTGWDATGPSGTYPTVWASQGGGPGSTLGVAVRIDPSTGKVLRQVADPKSCQVWDVASTGDFVCLVDLGTNASGTYDERVNVRRADGTEIWHFTLTTQDGLVYGPRLAPDEAHVAVGINSATEVVGRSGSRIRIGIYPDGWLDSSTLISDAEGLGLGPNLVYVGLGAPGTIVSLGFRGLFVGTVHM